MERSPLEENSGFLSQVFLTLPPGPYLEDPVLVGDVPFASGNGAGSLGAPRVWMCLGSGSNALNTNLQQEMLVGQLRDGN